MRIEPKVLENRHVRLEPMAPAHREDLRAACDADPATWIDLYPYSMAGEHFDPTWTRMQGDVAAGRTLAFAVVAGGRCGGVTCFSGIDGVNGVVEIGGTYYAPALRGGAVNPSAKRLLLGHAFESGARRVVFRVDAINARSRAAVAKLGATQEGILRQDRVCWTGRIRDTVIFSILNSEWPAVRDVLDARLAAFS
ncbi:MAG TPA: GNAT family protein [Phenylobacterium sp.]|jgi:RimJ/RimL family protein N-acetyltransferase|uniref:GNAT family N-acetyltransferase n=1 Tax=Phenylobacterium sp. TaxID=1871053 RepID=UPI002D2A79C6|nr:GNAT family protein [Phenylobacterium sp.]HZZ68525.1 GNAT family protein [Phenylobacterium sp.]